MGLEANNKIHNVQKKIGLVIVFSGYLCEQRWFEILETIEGASMKGPMEIQ